jgi:hypothetical protein
VTYTVKPGTVVQVRAGNNTESERLNFRRERMVRELFNNAKNPAHILHDILRLKCCSSSVSSKTITHTNYRQQELKLISSLLYAPLLLAQFY